MIEMYKYVTGKMNCNLKLNFHFTLASAYEIRGNSGPITGLCHETLG